MSVALTFDDLGTPLRDVTFCVVDLETTGGSPNSCAITEVGAVKVRGGEVLGEFATLVDPGCTIPPYITVLTGITTAMVVNAPKIAAVLPAFLEFANECVLVAHNAPFDVGFLRAAADTTGHEWPGFRVVDTARLARRVYTRDEAPNCRLETLARMVRATTAPCHRALADARATVDVLHAMFGRLGSFGVTYLEDLAAFCAQVSPEQRRKRHLADGLPMSPGVYLFVDARGEVLYIGKSRNLRARVRQYFLASEPRTRMGEMVALAERVDAVPCATDLEAEVRELRLIAEHKPRYNRRSRFPERSAYLKLTVEPFPRLSVVHGVREDDATYLGPFGSTRAAEFAMAAAHEAFRIRQCTRRMSVRQRTPACALAEIGRCGAPCDGRETPESYGAHVQDLRLAMTVDARPVVAANGQRIAALSAGLRYEEAAIHRDRVAAFVRAAARGQRLAAIRSCAQIVAARPTDRGGWEFAVIARGALVATGVVAPATAPRPVIDDVVACSTAPEGEPSAEESECLLRWLERPGTRLVDVDGTWCLPARGAGGLQRWLAAAYDDDGVRPLDDRRRLRPVHQPARGGVRR